MASEINAELMLEIKGFLDGIKKSQNAATKFASEGTQGASGWSGMLKSVGGAVATVASGIAVAGAAIVGVGAAVTGALAAGLKNALDLGGKFSDIASQIGSTAGKARVLANAFESNGMSAENVGTTVNKMSKSISDATSGLATAKKAFTDIGLNPDDLLAKDPTDAFKAIMEGLSGIENKSERTATAMAIFGRAGGKLNVLLDDSKAMENASKMIGRQAELLDLHATDFDRASDVLGQMGSKTQGFFVGVGSKIIDALMPVIDYLESVDLAGIGERFGAALMSALNVVKAIYQVFASMSLAEVATLFGTLLKLGIATAINFLMATSAAAFSAVIAYFIEGVKNAITLFSILATRDFWAGMLSALLGIAALLADALLKHLINYVSVMNNASERITGKRIFGGVEEKLGKTREGLAEESHRHFNEAGDSLTPAFNAVKERMVETGAAMGAAFTKTMADVADFIDTSEDKDAIAAVTEQIASVARQIAAAAPTKAETGAGGGGEEAAQASLPALNSRLSGAINSISGRSSNAIIAAEASKTSANTERTAKAAEQIAKNTAGGNTTKTPVPKPGSTGAGKFA